ncbi:hypothetical protein [Pyrococcus kukulkanii]|uniref:hypothetical protein n=1 Tax=Pyrococcus kukulkanii TaxID=1609559 RepID=UPI0035660FAA
MEFIFPLLLGYAVGQGSRDKMFEELRRMFLERIQHLAYFKAPIPYGFFEKSPTGKIYLRESLYAYLYGLPNASLILAFRALIEGIKIKYKEVEGKPPSRKMNYTDLIEWAHNFLKEYKALAHGFRVLRNWIEHEGGTVEEQDALEVFRHTCEILDKLHPPKINAIKVTCPNCGNEVLVYLPIYFGMQKSVRCDKCRREFPMTFLL